MDSHGDQASAEADHLATIKNQLLQAIAGLTKIGNHLPAAHAQMALDILEADASESDQSEFT
jgi:hypothetical protein